MISMFLVSFSFRCNAVRKSDDGKGTVSDYTPTLFAVAKGYDNVAFDSDDHKAETPSNEIQMFETNLGDCVNSSVSVA